MMSVLGRSGREGFFCLNRMAVHPYPNFPSGFLPTPYQPLPQGIYFNIIRSNILSALIKFWLWQIIKLFKNYLKRLTKAWYMDPWPLKPTHHEIELIGSSNLYNKIKAQLSRQRAVFPELHNHYCFRTRAVALPVWCYGHSLVNKPPPSTQYPAKTYMIFYSRAFG